MKTEVVDTPRRSILEQDPVGTTYTFAKWERNWFVEKVGSGRWKITGATETPYETTDWGATGAFACVQTCIKSRYGETQAAKKGMSLPEFVEHVTKKHNEAVAKGLRTKETKALGHLASRWKGNTRKVNYSGTTLYTNGHMVVAARYLPTAQREKLEKYAADTNLPELTDSHIAAVLPPSTDIAYRYLGAHPGFVGDKDNLVAVYMSDCGEHVAAVNTHFAPPPTLYGKGNEPPKWPTQYALVGDPANPADYVVMSVNQRLCELQDVAKELRGEVSKPLEDSFRRSDLDWSALKSARKLNNGDK